LKSPLLFYQDPNVERCGNIVERKNLLMRNGNLLKNQISSQKGKSIKPIWLILKRFYDHEFFCFYKSVRAITRTYLPA